MASSSSVCFASLPVIFVCLGPVALRRKESFFFLGEQRFRHFFQFLIPFLAEAFDEWVAQELIDRQFEFAAMFHGFAAHVPSVVVETDEAACKAFFADGVEIARDGLAP